MLKAGQANSKVAEYSFTIDGAALKKTQFCALLVRRILVAHQELHRLVVVYETRTST